MFANSRAFSGFAVDDLPAARTFYGEVLGIATSERNGLMTLHLAGGRDTLVYPKPGHVPAAYTILNFPGRQHRRGRGRADCAGRDVRALRRAGPGREGHQPGPR